MRKLLIITLLTLSFTSCSKDDSDNCNCTKSYYSFDDPNEPGTFVNSESVDCTDEVGKQFIDSDTYFTIECE